MIVLIIITFVLGDAVFTIESNLEWEVVASCQQYIETELIKIPGELYTCGVYGGTL